MVDGLENTGNLHKVASILSLVSMASFIYYIPNSVIVNILVSTVVYIHST